MFGIRHVCYACTSPALASRRAANANFFWSKFASPPPPHSFLYVYLTRGLEFCHAGRGRRGVCGGYIDDGVFFSPISSIGGIVHICRACSVRTIRGPPPPPDIYIRNPGRSIADSRVRATNYIHMYVLQTRRTGRQCADSASVHTLCSPVRSVRGMPPLCAT